MCGRQDGYNNDLSSVESLDTTSRSGQWNELRKQMAFPRGFHSAVVVGNVIYIIGGRDNNNNRLDSVEMFDTISKSFSNGPALPIPLF